MPASSADVAGFTAAFAAALHDEGVLVPPARAASFAAALDAAGPVTNRELYWVARVTLLSGHDQLLTFDRVFHRLFAPLDADASDPAEFRGDQGTVPPLGPAVPGETG